MSTKAVVSQLQEDPTSPQKFKLKGAMLPSVGTKAQQPTTNKPLQKIMEAPGESAPTGNMEFVNGIKDKIDALVWTSRQGLSRKDFNKEVEKIIEGSDTSAYSHKAPPVTHKTKSVPSKGISKLIAAYSLISKNEEPAKSSKEVLGSGNLLKDLAMQKGRNLEKSINFSRKPTEELVAIQGGSASPNPPKYSPRYQRPSSSKDKLGDYNQFLGEYQRQKKLAKKVPNPEPLRVSLDINGNKLKMEPTNSEDKPVYLPLVRLTQKDRAKIIYAQKQELLKEKLKVKLGQPKELGGFVKKSLKYIPLVMSERQKDHSVEGPLVSKTVQGGISRDGEAPNGSPQLNLGKKSGSSGSNSNFQGSPIRMLAGGSLSLGDSTKAPQARLGVNLGLKNNNRAHASCTTSSQLLPGISQRNNQGLSTMFQQMNVFSPSVVKSMRLFHVMHGFVYQQTNNPFLVGAQQQTFKFFVGPGNNQKLVYASCKLRLPSLQESFPSKCHLSWTQNPAKKGVEHDDSKDIGADLPVCSIDSFKLSNPGIQTKDPLNYAHLVKDISSVEDLVRAILETRVFECSEPSILRNLLTSLYTDDSNAQNSSPNQFPKSHRPSQSNAAAPAAVEGPTHKLNWSLVVHPSPYDTNNPLANSLWPMCNHVRGLARSLTSKTGLFQTLSWYCYSHGLNPWAVMPKTYLIKSATAAADIRQLVEEKSASLTGWNMPVIIKPGEDSNRGNGIGMGYDAQSARSEIERVLERHKSKKGTAIVQDYLTKTLLFKGRKFDIRCYGLVAKFGKVVSYYWYKEGYARTSSYFYNPNEKDNLKVHLTNEAVQVKDSSTFGKYEPGNKVYFPELNAYFDTVSAFIFTNKNFYRDIVPLFKAHAQLAFKAASDKIIEDNQNFSSPSFELLGFDFMITESLEVFLIEVNHNPCLSTLTPEQGKLITKLVDETLKLTADPILMLSRVPTDTEKPPREGALTSDPARQVTSPPEGAEKVPPSPMYELLYAHRLP